MKTESIDPRREKLIVQAVEAYVTALLESGIYRDDEFTPSKSFEKRINKLIKSRHSLYHRATLTRARKILCVAAIILALMLSTLSVGAVREKLAGFFVSHIDGYNVISSDKNTKGYPETLEEIYQIEKIPPGYKYNEESSMLIDNDAVNIYSKGEESLWFEQITKSAFRGNFDNEYSEHKSEFHNGQLYYVINFDDGYTNLIWDNGRYIFILLGNFSENDLYEIAESIKIKE